MVELAKKVNAPIINMHISDGVHFTLQGKKVYFLIGIRKGTLTDYAISEMLAISLLAKQLRNGRLWRKVIAAYRYNRQWKG